MTTAKRPQPNEQDLTAKTALKEQRARDAATAMRDYERERIAVVAKTERLRAERLARDAQIAEQAKLNPPAPAKPKPKVKVRKAAPRS